MPVGRRNKEKHKRNDGKTIFLNCEPDNNPTNQKELEMKNFLVLLLVCFASVFFAGCSSLPGKAVGIASNGTVIKVETTGSTTSGTIAPNLLFGTVQNSLTAAPAIDKTKTTQVVVSYTESQSSLAAAFGHTAITRTFSYIGLPGEDAEQTKVRLDAVAKVLTQNASASTSVSSAAVGSSSTTTGSSTASAGSGDASSAASGSSVSAASSVASITDSTGTTYARNASAYNGTTAYAWTSTGDSAVTVYTASASPAAGDAIYSDKGLTTKTNSTVASK